ncbi:MAG: lipocalin family protein [Bacteroidota bacterium]
MKLFVFVLFFIFLYTIQGFSQPSGTDTTAFKDLIIGKWRIETIEFTNEMQGTYAVFDLDSTFTMLIPCDLIKRDDTIHVKSNYVIKADKLIIRKQDKKSPDQFQIIKLTDSELILRCNEEIRYSKVP